MRIAEIFYSIQGEGQLLGVPSVFVRTSGCNLRCVWCDTPYTSWEAEGRTAGVSEILEEVQGYGAGHVVVTGGEPMVTGEVVELTRGLREMGMHITIETAGTAYQPVACDLMSISPKLRNSTPVEREGGRFAVMHEERRLPLEVLRRLTAEYAYQLKFVVEAPGDLEEIEGLRRELGAARGAVMLMPEGRDRDVLRERMVWMAEVCKERGYRMSPRLHVDLWGDRRGI
jgi:7-carboxy-7-deazaguanine synthase